MPLSILIVEDDSLEAARLETALSRKGYRCVLADDGDGALARLSLERFDAVLLDLVLPGLDGMGVLRRMSARGLAVPVVVQVTPAGLDAAADAIRAGARDFVVKPAGALRLEVALANAIALGRAARPEAEIRTGTVVPFAPPAAPAAPGDAAQEHAFALLESAGHVRRLEQIEAEAIRFACHLYGGRMAEVARRLGIGRSTLYRKLAELDPDTVGRNREAEPLAPQFVAAE